jgi:hypothetical protein
MKINPIGISIFSICFIGANFAQAQNRAGSGTGVVTTTPTYSATTTTTTTMYKYSGPTIKDAAAQAIKNSNSGMNMAMAAAGITGAGVAATCWNPSTAAQCKLFAAGLAASMASTLFMKDASNQSLGTYKAVDAANDVQNPNGIRTEDETPALKPSNLSDNPDWITATNAKTKLENSGWKIDSKGKSVTTPDGTVVPASALNSASGMAAAGASASDILAFQNAMKKVEEKAAKLNKSAVDGSMFDDAGGGGGGGSKSASAATPYLPPIPSGPKLGINRDPAQVAGMKKDYNGSPIGVAGDSLFDMVDRRYKLHQENGSFLSP